MGAKDFMALTSDQIAEILSSLGHTRAATAVEKRRRAPRVKHRDILTIIPYMEGVSTAPRQATLVDFSSRGVALRFAEQLPSGMQFVLLLPRTCRQPLRLLCQVVHSQIRSDGAYAVGSEFVGLAPQLTPSVASNSSDAVRIAESILA
jgi:hypothetical protein